MKNLFFAFILLGTTNIIASPSVDEVKELFSPDAVNSERIMWKEKKYQVFMKDLRKSVYEENRKELEIELIKSMCSFNPKTSAGHHGEVVNVRVIEDRGLMFASILEPCKTLQDDVAMYEPIAEYLGGIAAFKKDKEHSSPWRVSEEDETLRQYRVEVIRVCASALPILKKKISADSYKKLLEKFSATAGLDEVEKIVLEEHMMGANEYLKRMKDALRKKK